MAQRARGREREREREREGGREREREGERDEWPFNKYRVKCDQHDDHSFVGGFLD